MNIAIEQRGLLVFLTCLDLTWLETNGIYCWKVCNTKRRHTICIWTVSKFLQYVVKLNDLEVPVVLHEFFKIKFSIISFGCNSFLKIWTDIFLCEHVSEKYGKIYNGKWFDMLTRALNNFYKKTYKQIHFWLT